MEIDHRVAMTYFFQIILVQLLLTACTLKHPVCGEVVAIAAEAGRNVQFNCSTRFQHPVNWELVRSSARPDDSVDVFSAGVIQVSFAARCSITEASGYFNLTISRLRMEDAGTYICVDNAGLGEPLLRYLLIVIDNIFVPSPDALVVNLQCPPTETSLNLTIAFRHQGACRPWIVWTENEKPIDNRASDVFTEIQSNAARSSLIIHGDSIFDGNTFVVLVDFKCTGLQEDLTIQHPIQLQKWKTSVTNELNLIERNPPKTVTVNTCNQQHALCSCNTTFTQCRHRWINDETNLTETTISYLELSNSSTYRYRCELQYGKTCSNIQKIVSCEREGDKNDVDKKKVVKRTAIIVGLVLSVIISALIVCAIIIIIGRNYHVRKRRKLPIEDDVSLQFL